MKVYEDIKRDAYSIESDSFDGCRKAKQVIDLHKMCVKSADVPTVTLLECAYDDWLNKAEGKR